jgi:two-component system phosphate regulon sensor histidine kinase PhoR
MLKKIGNRIILSFIILITAIITSFVFIINTNLREYHLNVLKREMSEKIDICDLAFKQNNIYKNISRIKNNNLIYTIADIIKLRLSIVDPDGNVLADSEYRQVAEMDNHKYRPEIRDAFEEGTGNSIRYSNTLKTDMLYYANRRENIVIRLSKPLTEIDQSIARIRKHIIVSGSVAVFLSIIFIIFISRKLTRHIKDTKIFAEDFSMGDYSRRILNYSNDEIGTLQKALNKMADTMVEKINSLIFEQNKLEKIIENIQNGIAVIDLEKKVIVANSAFKYILDITIPPEKKHFYESIRNRELNSRIERSLETKQSTHFELELISGKYCDIFITPVFEEASVQGIVIVLHDITEKKKTQQIKADLVANMSHELKTPITILKGYLETIIQHLDNSELSRELISKALDNVDRQNSLINDILKLNKLETAADFPEEEIDLNNIISDCIEILRPKTQKKNININYKGVQAYREIKGNKFLVQEIFFNIIDNAINYNKENGRIDIESEIENNSLKIKIRDTGIGIPDESKDRIFERFYRVDKGRSRTTGGTGLGLAIVKHAADILNWDISLSSGARGSTFTIII